MNKIQEVVSRRTFERPIHKPKSMNPTRLIGTIWSTASMPGRSVTVLYILNTAEYTAQTHDLLTAITHAIFTRKSSR